ncbi:unnamed protein product [Spirodela intermedia]|uniref:Uncharacterized protein n=1 Tax=Spirodela intermedia TaxID=51605 RepID=A0A7I8J9E8_SPIIN|nr:unnamed protein product [Spirodela intermedia]CAA6666063.1 unnamed protein product [Spirodela intermedia]
MEATVALGSGSRPQSRIMSSYHHHSKQTDTQLGVARRTRGLHPPRHLRVGASHVETRKRSRAKLAVAEAAATPETPRRRCFTRKRLTGTWTATANKAASVNGRVRPWERR